MLVFIDVETGGLDEREHSLLEVAFVLPLPGEVVHDRRGCNRGSDGRAVLVGWNPSLDNRFLQRMWSPANGPHFGEVFSHRAIDLHSAMKLMSMTRDGWPKDVTLHSTIEFFGIADKAKDLADGYGEHRTLYDMICTQLIYRELMECLS